MLRGIESVKSEIIINPYLLHFGNIQERHLWKINPKFTFWSLMTSYMISNLWRHMNLKQHQLGYLYITWPKSRDVISVRYHVMKVITPEKPRTELASFLKKKIQTRLGTSGSVISGKIIHFATFQLFWWLFWKKKRISGNE